VDPGRTDPPVHTIPKVVSGLDDLCPGSLEAITRLYSKVFDNIVSVSKPEVAEMMKLYENCQRMVCIAYANEMADACIPHGIDPFEVCKAAGTKPFGYMPYKPGIGVGGHCIPVNPFYLLSNGHFPLLQAATELMATRPARLADRVINCPSEEARPLRILVVGMGFKPGQASLSNSPSLALIKRLTVSGKLDVSWADTLVSQDTIPQIPRLPEERWNKAALETFDRIIVSFEQVGMDFGVLDELQGVCVERWYGC
jgi:nucleotide sugar dehydrogenase